MINFVKQDAFGYKAYNIFGGFQLAELAGRNCYKTEGKSGPGTYRDFLKMIIKRNHLSILEHCPFYFICSDNILAHSSDIDIILHSILRSPFSRNRYNPEKCKFSTYTNFRVIYEKAPKLAMELLDSNIDNVNDVFSKWNIEWFYPEESDTYSRVTMNITTLRSISDELVRERIASPSVESTRWCDYSNDKFNSLTFCLPHWIKNDVFDIHFNNVLHMFKDVDTKNMSILTKLYQLRNIASTFVGKYYPNEADVALYYKYITLCIDSAINYCELKDSYNLSAQDAREFLPLGIRSTVIYTAFYSDWLTILDKRLRDSTGKAHPNMHNLMVKVQDHINTLMGLDKEEDGTKENS